MLTNQSVPDVSSQHPVLRALAHGRRRAAISVLDRVDRMTVTDLATHVVAIEEGTALVEVSRSDIGPVTIDLRSTHLPALEDAGLVSQTDDGVELTDHPATRVPQFWTIVETDVEGWDDVLRTLASKRNRIVLMALSDSDTAISLDDLAQHIATQEGDDTDAETRRELRQELHHRHVPALEDAGLVAYDAGRRELSYEGHPGLDDSWLFNGPGDLPRAILPEATRTEGIWTITGPDNVVTRGRSIFDQADEELFIMATNDALFEAACIECLQDAVDRGVDVYVGMQDDELRTLIQQQVPGVTIWEPRLNWLNLPPEHGRVGRLVMADREEVVVGMVGQENEYGVPEETALTAQGRYNPLVTLLCEMLGDRLSHLDEQSADFLAELAH